MISTVGFIGVGHLADYTSRGLRRGGFAGEIFLSPRNAERAEVLARDCGGRICESNQAVVETAEAVILSVRPALAQEAMESVTLAEGQRLISVCAGLSVEKLRPLAPQARIYRAMPVTSAAVAESPTLVFPRDDEVEALFDMAGQAVGVESEEEYEAGAVLATVYGWFFPLFDRLVRDTEAAGVSPEAARQLVLGMAKGAAAVAQEDKSRSLDDIAWEIATEGSFTRLGLEHLLERDAFTPWDEAFEKVLAALKG